MAILTDLPNELLRIIIADVSPLYIERLALTCKRIYILCTDTIREHDNVRSKLPTEWPMSRPIDLIRAVFQDPTLALYPTSWEICVPNLHCWRVPKDLVPEINLQILQGPHAALLELTEYMDNPIRLVVPLLITRLLNLRRVNISIRYQMYYLKTVSRLIEAIHDPVNGSNKPLALARLTEALVGTSVDSIHGIRLAVLLSMLPSLTKLKVSCFEEPQKCNSFKYPNHRSGVKDIHLDGLFESRILKELIRRTYGLQRFTCTHVTDGCSPRMKPRYMIDLLKRNAGHTLQYLNLPTGSQIDICDRCSSRNSIDLSLGSLRGFSLLKTLVTSVDMFIKTRGQRFHKQGSGTVERLTSWLPASLETLVLHQGLADWDKDILQSLFRGFQKRKKVRLPRLKLINFVKMTESNQVLSDDIRAACRITGVEINFNGRSCSNCNCTQMPEQLEGFLEREWIATLGRCPQLDYSSWDHGSWSEWGLIRQEHRLPRNR